MKDEEIKKYLGKKVKITLANCYRETYKGILKVGYIKLGSEWVGTGYHLERKEYDLGFKKSYIKKIEVIEDEKNN